MKKLTLLILLASITLMGFGQVLTLIDTDTGIDSLPPDEPIMRGNVGIYPLIDSYIEVYISGYKISSLTSDSSLFLMGMRVITLNDLLKYADECYRDSTKEFMAVYKKWDTGDKFISRRPEAWEMIIGYQRDTVYYSHKEFKMPGFIEWLKKE